MASIEINVRSGPVRDSLQTLLTDRSSKKNIIFATDSYADQGEVYGAKRQITEQLLIATEGCIIQPRVLKDSGEQQLRTRKRAEVFTPAWVCCLMNNYIDEEWFGRKDVFCTLNGQHWTRVEANIEMPEGKKWQTYVDSRRLEITCGEAPYLVSRYDMATGEIIPIKDRIGILDRKLRIVNENAATEEEWLKWTLRAFQAVYGYEYQGDNLLVARINLLLTYIDYMQDRWDRKPTKKELEEIAKVISWNIWQMDGLKGVIPLGALYEQYRQMTIFDMFGTADNVDDGIFEECIPCRVFDWRGQKKSLEYQSFREGRNGSMKFDYIIGNPPYQDEVMNKGDRANPVYDKYMNSVYDLANVVELITPARFLFNAGQTSKKWNKKMLSDPHFTVLHYEPDASKIFPNTEIKGGVAITLRNTDVYYGEIGIFKRSDELDSILNKVTSFLETEGALERLVSSRGTYRFSELFYEDYPNAATLVGKGSGNMIVSNIFDKLSDAFLSSRPENTNEYLIIIGRTRSTRVIKYLYRRYVMNNEYINSYKVMIPESSGTGRLGEALSTPFIANPGEGATDSFISIGFFQDKAEAESLLAYIKTKFARAMLAVYKATQHNSKSTWRAVPLQDFTPASDIDWTKSIADIDRQLYAKYGLSDEEINFIETHVKEMA